jgi:hypothetical protein
MRKPMAFVQNMLDGGDEVRYTNCTVEIFDTQNHPTTFDA